MRKLNRNKTEVIFAGTFNPQEKLSGSEKVAKRIFEAYTKNHQSVFIDYFLDGKKYGIIKKLFGHELVQEVNGSPVLKTGIFKLILTVLKCRPRIIHLITYERFYSILFFLRPLFRYKIIYNVHGIRIYENEINGSSISTSLKHKDKTCEKLIFKRSDKLLFLSQNSFNLASKYYQLNKAKTQFIKNGVDEIFHKISVNKNFKNNVLKIVFVGEVINKLKGFDFLLNALRKLNFSVELYVISDSRIETSNSEKLILTFHKRMDTVDFANFLKDKTVYVSASKSDSFSITAVECMSAGLIPILTNQTGSSELIDNNVNGFAFNFNDENSLINILIELNGNQELQNRISSESKKIYNELSWTKVCESYVKIYENML
ncbi:MAG TPA: glycosyltransferase [Ignavibacteria bacterium]|nr:glycosyltransferase [Ignavibacteria bacterium]